MLLGQAGERCQEKMQLAIHALPAKDVQIDEIWGYVFKKEGDKWDHEKTNFDIGDSYCLIGIERHTKLILAWHLGKRDADATETFIAKLAWAATKDRYQLTSDGFKYYVPAIKGMLRNRVDYAQLIKVYGVSRDRSRSCHA
jgi:hypothetical protein